MAKTVSIKSHCKRLKVGSVIVDNLGVVSTGFNGSPRGTDNNCEEDNVTLPTIIHSEENAILFANKPLTGATIYCTTSPCLRCAAKIIQVGIKKVYYLNDYRTPKAVSYLRHNGIKVLKMYYDCDK